MGTLWNAIDESVGEEKKTEEGEDFVAALLNV